MLRLGNLKCQAVLVGSKISTHTTTRLPRWWRLRKPASLHTTTALLASNVYAGQHPKPQHWVLTPKGNPYIAKAVDIQLSKMLTVCNAARVNLGCVHKIVRSPMKPYNPHALDLFLLMRGFDLAVKSREIFAG